MTVYGILEAVERTGQTTLDLSQTPELSCMNREVEQLREEVRRSPNNARLVDLL